MKHLTIPRILLLSVIWPGCLALLLCSSPAFASGTGYEGHSKGHGSPHHKANYSGHGKGHHGSSMKGHGSMGHGSGHHGSAIKGHGSHGSFGKGHGGGHSVHGGGHGKHTGAHQSASEFIKHVLKYKKGMAITDEQEAKLKSVETNFKKTRIKMKAEVELANLDLHELLKNENSSLSDIEAKLKNVHILEADLLLASVKAKRDAKAVLTDEQRKRMKAVHDRIQAYASGGMGHKGHPGGYKHHGKDQKKDNY